MKDVFAAPGALVKRLAITVLSALTALAITGAPAAHAQVATASIVLGDPNQEQGLTQLDQPDGHTTPVTANGLSARTTAPGDNPDWGRYIYFNLDDQIAHDGYYVAKVEVSYLDEGTNSFGLQYDSNDCTATLSGAYTNTPRVTKANTGQW